ncbi:MAG: rRNA (cytidine-2'-O-)-methyltransferase [Halobacteriovoraceae bacterium]|nr:rRNA (cytidine-2'-O-)-methyltransferase [Halobacteriovoraceae bacterium]
MSRLILLSVPIGNSEDLTLRGKKTLEEKTLFFVEDTRPFFNLLRSQGIESGKKKVYSFHEHSKDSRLQFAKKLLEEGEEIVFCSDAGSPLMSDPAHPLVNGVLDWGFELETVPGVSSVIAALELSGLPPYPFQFHGFLPREPQKKKSFIALMGVLGKTHVFFESPKRVDHTLKQIKEALPEADVAVLREITKRYETAYRFKASDYESERIGINFKGEFVIVLSCIEGRDKAPLLKKAEEMALNYLESGSVKDLSKLLGSLLDRPSKEVYGSLAKMKKGK